MLTDNDKMFEEKAELTDRQKEMIDHVEVLSKNLIEDIKDESSTVEMDYHVEDSKVNSPFNLIPGATYYELNWCVK